MLGTRPALGRAAQGLGQAGGSPQEEALEAARAGGRTARGRVLVRAVSAASASPRASRTAAEETLPRATTQ